MEIAGTCAIEFAPVREAFARCFAELGEVGAATCVYLNGRPMVDLWGGIADPESGRAWGPDTLVHVYSVTKPFAAVCLLLLVDRGLVELDAPVAAYWPEFAQAGKARIPVRWLLTHQAGVLGIRQPQPRAAIFDWDRIVALLAAEPSWEGHGCRHGGHAYFFDHIVGEVVRRVGGRTFDVFLLEEVARPWTLDFHVGLSAGEQARCATVTGLSKALRDTLIGEQGSIYEQALGNPPAVLDGEVINSPAWRQAAIPAVNGHGTAHAIARFYGGLANGGGLDGVRLLSEALVRDAVAVHVAGEDLLLKRPVSWGLGFQVDTDGFGLGRIGGALGWGNLAHHFGFGYVTNSMASHARALLVYQAAAEVIGIPVAPEQ